MDAMDPRIDINEVKQQLSLLGLQENIPDDILIQLIHDVTNGSLDKTSTSLLPAPLHPVPVITTTTTRAAEIKNEKTITSNSTSFELSKPVIDLKEKTICTQPLSPVVEAGEEMSHSTLIKSKKSISYRTMLVSPTPTPTSTSSNRTDTQDTNTTPLSFSLLNPHTTRHQHNRNNMSKVAHYDTTDALTALENESATITTSSYHEHLPSPRQRSTHSVPKPIPSMKKPRSSHRQNAFSSDNTTIRRSSYRKGGALRVASKPKRIPVKAANPKPRNIGMGDMAMFFHEGNKENLPPKNLPSKKSGKKLSVLCDKNDTKEKKKGLSHRCGSISNTSMTFHTPSTSKAFQVFEDQATGTDNIENRHPRKCPGNHEHNNLERPFSARKNVLLKKSPSLLKTSNSVKKVKKSDPVAMYHKRNEEWKNNIFLKHSDKARGTNVSKKSNAAIVTSKPKRLRPKTPSTFVAPNEKRRDSLRLAIRAKMMSPPK